MARHRRSEGLRDRILDACETQLAAGPASVTAREVAAAAGVSNGTLFHYFPSVDDLLLAVADRVASTQGASFGDPSADGIDVVLARLFDPARRDTVLPWLRQRAPASPTLTAALQRYDRDVNAQYAAALRAVADRIGLRDDVDIEAAVEVVRALAEGFQLRLGSDTLTVDAERFVATVIDAVRSAWLDQRSMRAPTRTPSKKNSGRTRTRSSAR
jgi:AcrR family transcriptional regulator